MANEHEPLTMLMLRLSQRHDIRNVSLLQLEALAKDIAKECIMSIYMASGDQLADMAVHDALQAIEDRFDLIEA